MMDTSDVIGAHIKQLQNRVLVQHAPTVARFKRREIDRQGHDLQTIDACSEYTLLAPTSDNGLVGCLNSCAVFTMLEQKPVKKRQGLTQAYSVLVTLKCEFVNIRDGITKYLFQVLADHDVCNHGYFHNIQVNQNGSLLLLTAASAVYVVRIPTEMDDDNVVADAATQALLYSSIIRAERVLSRCTGWRRHAPLKVVKAKFHQQYANTICLLTMEQKSDATQSAEGFDKEDASTRRSDGILIGNGSESAGSYHNDGDAQMRASWTPTPLNVEMQGVVRIFNVDQSIDSPYMTLKLTEGMCRTGDANAKFDADATPQGAAVDFAWVAEGEFTWRAMTLLVMSNYGLIFAYCPILLPACINTFSRKRAIMNLSLDLMKKGYRMKAVPHMDRFTGHEDVTLLMGSLANISQSKEVKTDEDEVVILPSVYRLETEHVVRPMFDAMVVINTEPEIAVVASASNGDVALYKSKVPVVPRTTHFYRPGARTVLAFLRVDEDRNHSAKCDSRVRLIRISENTCLAHSAMGTDVLTINGGDIDVKNIVKTRFAGDHVYYHSQPLIVADSGEKHTHHAFEGKWCDRSRNVYMFQAKYCYIVSQQELKHLATTVGQTSCFYRSSEREIAEQPHKSVEFPLVPMVRAAIALPPAVETMPSISQPVNSSMQKLVQRAAEAEAFSKQAFKNARELVKKEGEFKTKAVAMVKLLSEVDSRTMFYLKGRKVFEDSLAESIEVYNKLHADAEKVFADLPAFHQRVQDLKARAQRIKRNNEDMVERQQRIALMKLELRQSGLNEASVQQLADLITHVYIKCSQNMCKQIAYRVNQDDKLYNYKECVKRVIDQWLAETLNSNIETMEKTFARIQSIRNRIIDLS
ncbi:transposase orfB, putative [Babesia ovata]|uniref:Transposase orfB, putative n=1 Tax=Babesia ovata TaxID=189622 RepID=A0A2H6KG09_9APIC|nr:transposase orfB, putative [Babesia ovata]GBE61932.1 transposase orfB, putative [Babesia ovata]